METAKRRKAIMQKLIQKRHDTIPNLASEFGVSQRTIMRDINELSITEPIYTHTGRYAGGVYIADGYLANKAYLPSIEIELLTKISISNRKNGFCVLTPDEDLLLGNMITKYKKPIINMERKDEKTGNRLV